MAIQQQPASVFTRRNFPRLIWVLAALFFGSALILQGSQKYQLLNLLTWLSVGVLAVLVAVLPRQELRLWVRLSAWARRHHIDLPLLLLGVGLGVVTAIRHIVRLRMGGTYTGNTALLWVLSWSALLASVWPADAPSLRAFVRAHKLELLGVLGVTALAGVLRLYRLGSLPNVVNGDEGLIGMWALMIGDGGDPRLDRHFASMDGVGILYLAFMRKLFDFAGTSDLTLRLLPALAGTLAIPANYLLARHLMGRRAALIATGLLLVSHTHIHFSRTVAVSYIYSTLFVPLALYFLISGMERRSALRLMLSAVVVGLHINVYIDGWVWLILLGLLLLAWAIFDRQLFKGNGLNLGLFALTIVIVMAPMVIWMRMFPLDSTSRISADGTIASGWLAREVELTGKNHVQILLELFQYAMSVFTSKNSLYFYFAEAPMLDRLTGLLWMGGVALMLMTFWKRQMLLLNGWFWGGIVALALMTVPKETYHYRLLVVLPVACMLAGYCAEWLLRALAGPGAEQASFPSAESAPPAEGAQASVTARPPAKHSSQMVRQWSIAMVGLLLFASSYLNIKIYFDEFSSSCRYGMGYWTRESSFMGNYLSTLPRDTRVYVLPKDLDASFFYGPYKSVDFLSGRMHVDNYLDPLGDLPPEGVPMDGSVPLVFVANADRWHEFDRLRTWLPSGQETRVTDCGSEKLAFFSWQP